MKHATLIIAMMILLSGCSVLEKAEQSPMTARLVTNQITLRLIADAEDPVERATKVREVVAKVRDQFDGEQTYTLADIDTAVREEIDWKRYNPADQEALDYALVKANKALSELIGEGAVKPGDRETLATFVRWIDNAALRVQ